MTDNKRENIEVRPMLGVRAEDFCPDDWVTAYRQHLAEGGVVNMHMTTSREFALRFDKPYYDGDVAVVTVLARDVTHGGFEDQHSYKPGDMTVDLRVSEGSETPDESGVIVSLMTDQNSRNRGINDDVWMNAFRTGGGLEAFASGELLCMLEVDGEFYDFSIDVVQVNGGGPILIGWAYETEMDPHGLREARVDRIAGGAVMRVSRMAPGYEALASAANIR